MNQAGEGAANTALKANDAKAEASPGAAQRHRLNKEMRL